MKTDKNTHATACNPFQYVIILQSRRNGTVRKKTEGRLYDVNAKDIRPVTGQQTDVHLPFF